MYLLDFLIRRNICFYKIKTPELRFIEFEDNYEETFLKNIVKIPKKEKITSVDDKKLLTVKLHAKGIEINEGVVPKLSKKGRPYYIRNANEILIGRQNFHNGGIGIVPEELDGGICSNAITSFINNRNIVSIKFLFYYLSRSSYYKRSEKYVGGTGQKEFSEKILLDLKIKIPSLEEQEKISSFLSIMDKKLFLMEKKHSLYVDIKKYLLKNLFVHEDEKSFLRFKKYNNVLQRVSLSEILEESKIKTKDDINKRISVKLNLKGVVKRIPNTNEIEGATTQYLRKKGQFIYGKQNLYKGAFGIVPSNLDGYLSSSDIPSFDFIKPIDEMWLFYYLSDKDYYTKLERLSTGTGSKRISPEDFLKIKINIPSIEEQKEISNMLKFLDHKIENIKKQIFLFSKFKKGLLQKMFC